MFRSLPDADAWKATHMPIEIDNKNHCAEFIRLNELWIKEHFSLEESDRKLAADPYRIVREGGHILSVVDDGVVGVCALFRESPTRYELARMAVDPCVRGRGIGDALMRAAIELAKKDGAETLYLLSNTVLSPAIALYRKHGFRTVSEGPHPVYSRCNIVMELTMPATAVENRDAMSFRELLAWAWRETPPVHRSAANLIIHLFAVPLFVAGHLLVLAAFFSSFWLAVLGLLSIVVSLILQRVGHSFEVQQVHPFTSGRDFVRRLYAEQFCNFWRFLFSGQWFANFSSRKDRQVA
jgi:putative acetyltransferase